MGLRRKPKPNAAEIKAIKRKLREERDRIEEETAKRLNETQYEALKKIRDKTEQKQPRRRWGRKR